MEQDEVKRVRKCGWCNVTVETPLDERWARGKRGDEEICDVCPPCHAAFKAKVDQDMAAQAARRAAPSQPRSPEGV